MWKDGKQILNKKEIRLNYRVHVGTEALLHNNWHVEKIMEHFQNLRIKDVIVYPVRKPYNFLFLIFKGIYS